MKLFLNYIYGIYSLADTTLNDKNLHRYLLFDETKAITSQNQLYYRLFRLNKYV